jgi:D-arabinitol dehydrogenase (NADP+)
MKAIVYSGPGEFSLQDLQPREPGSREVVVRPTMVGVCGTDLHIHDGGFFAEFPLTTGHEISGEVVRWGEQVTGLREGQRVVVDNASPCGHCPPCGAGRPLFCHNFASLGVNRNGGFAEEVLSPADKVFPASDLDPDLAVVAEPLACAVHGMDVLKPELGANVLLFGAGPTGVLLAQLLMHGGAGSVTVAAPTAFKLEHLARYGVNHTILIPRDDPAEAVRRVREHAAGGYDIAIDATGASPLVQQLPGLVREGGTLMVYGMCGEPETVAWSPYDIFRRELTVKGSFAQVNCFERALALLRSGRIRTDGLITHRFALADYGKALNALRSDNTCLKAIIHNQ